MLMAKLVPRPVYHVAYRRALCMETHIALIPPGSVSVNQVRLMRFQYSPGTPGRDLARFWRFQGLCVYKTRQTGGSRKYDI